MPEKRRRFFADLIRDRSLMGKLRGFARAQLVRLSLSGEDSEDVLQEVLMKLHKNLSKKGEETLTEGLVYQAIRHAVLDCKDRAVRRPIETSMPEFFSAPDTQAASPEDEFLCKEDTSAKSDVIRARLRRIENTARERLRPLQAKTVIFCLDHLFEVGEMPGTPRVAETFGLSYSAAAARQHRAKKFIESRLCPALPTEAPE